MKKISFAIIFLLIMNLNIVYANNDPVVEKVVIIKDGLATELSNDEYLKLVEGIELKEEDTKKNEEDLKPSTRFSYYVYDQSSVSLKKLATNERSRISSYAQNHTSSPANFALEISTSSSESFSINVSSSQKFAIEAGASFSWNRSSSVSETHQLTLKPGERGWIEFSPMYNHTYGYLKTVLDGGIVTNQVYVIGTSPAKTSGGNLDGVYYYMSQQY